MNIIKKYNIHIAWTISTISTFISLILDKIFGFTPCELCWYQRILLYPLVINIGILIYYNDTKVKRFVLPFTFFGILVSLYHILLQKIPLLQKIETCTSSIPCSTDYLNWFGFITIPMFSFIVFLSITLLIIIKK